MATEEQLATLKTRLKDLEMQLGQLTEATAPATPGTGTSAASTTPNIRVSVPREKRFGKYGGTRDDRVLEDWISDAQRAVRGQSDGEAVDTSDLSPGRCGQGRGEAQANVPVVLSLWSLHDPEGGFQ